MKHRRRRSRRNPVSRGTLFLGALALGAGLVWYLWPKAEPQLPEGGEGGGNGGGGQQPPVDQTAQLRRAAQAAHDVYVNYQKWLNQQITNFPNGEIKDQAGIDAAKKRLNQLAAAYQAAAARAGVSVS